MFLVSMFTFVQFMSLVNWMWHIVLLLDGYYLLSYVEIRKENISFGLRLNEC